MARALLCPLLWVTIPLKGVQSPGKRWWPPKISILRSCQNWSQRSPASSRGQPRVWGRRMWRHPPPNPPIEELQKWVTWKARVNETPSWWQELAIVPGVDDYKKLAHEVRASFLFPKRVSELCWVKNKSSGPTSTTMSSQKEFPATARFYLCLSGYPGDPAWEDSGIHLGSSVLGRVGWSAY